MPDFNGDGRDDILWWNSEGWISNWLAAEGGGWLVNDSNALFRFQADQWPHLYWEMEGFGDFNGDGNDDILWMGGQQEVSTWLGTDNGGFVVNDANAFTTTPEGHGHTPPLIGDFNGDGHDDLLWRSFGQLWFGNDSGGFTPGPGHVNLSAPSGWYIIFSGDFNGDGYDDFLWRNDLTGALSNWLALPEGGFAVNDANAWHDVPMEWFVSATGDFNGDGHDDLLWHNWQTNEMSNWLGTETGGFEINDANAFFAKPEGWWVVGVGDFDGDGRSDLLWRGPDGALSNWLGTDTGGWLVNDAVAYAQVDEHWQTGAYADSADWWDI